MKERDILFCVNDYRAITSDLSSACWEDKITFYANSLIRIQIYSCVCLELVRTDLWPQWLTGIEEFVFVYTHVIVTDRAAATSRMCSISQSVLNCQETEAKQLNHNPCILDLWERSLTSRRKSWNQNTEDLKIQFTQIMLSHCFRFVTWFRLHNFQAPSSKSTF